MTEAGEISYKEDQGFNRRFYKLAIGVNGLRRNPWQSGMVYVLSPDTFEYWNEWTSRVPVTPLMKLAVEPADLPLRHEVWGIDRRIRNNHRVDPEDPFPFLKEVLTTPIHPSGRPPWG